MGDNRFHKDPLWILNKEKLTAREMDEVFNYESE